MQFLKVLVVLLLCVLAIGCVSSREAELTEEIEGLQKELSELKAQEKEPYARVKGLSFDYLSLKLPPEKLKVIFPYVEAEQILIANEKFLRKEDNVIIRDDLAVDAEIEEHQNRKRDLNDEPILNSQKTGENHLAKLIQSNSE